MPEPLRHSADVEVRYVETDQMGHVHHANYIVWFELARTQLCARTGVPYADIEKLGYFMVVTGVEIRYRQPAHYGETVTVTAWIDHITSRLTRFAYEVRRDDALLATGATEHIWVDRTTRRPCRIPEPAREPFARLCSASAASGGD